MPEPFSRSRIPEPTPRGYGLFLAIFPDADAVQLIGKHQINLRKKFGLTGHFRPPHHLHVTLDHLGNWTQIPDVLIASVIKMCASELVNRPAFEVTFDHVKSFRGRPGNHPFVLVNPTGNEALMAFHQSFIQKPKFVPHVTLLYDRKLVQEQPVPALSWTVQEVVLVLSHLGLTKYERLGSWKLQLAH